ncbi:MAG: guanylate kinase [Flavobacteriaceae bacterium]
MKSQKLIVFSAPSGSGKTTLVHHLLKQNLPLGFSISATSRAPRGEEKNGVEYHFLSPEDFKKQIHENAFVEYEEVYKNAFYGTLTSELELLWSEGKQVLFDIDVKGGLSIKKKYPTQTLAIFVEPPSIEELESRLRIRATDSNEKIKERIGKAKTEMAFAKQFDYCLINDDLKTAKKEVVQVVSDFLNS